ncbi:hypothetical protein E2C01_026205 [Portunus trituberculatus]|uniref:Uncharacterized protein n=1 Tax=Portunus trituberculatus TaxID=210409 RepID=A0A5B7EFF0_PORTR|nr:hypothetical protein [Portunus trituberculatus]
MSPTPQHHAQPSPACSPHLPSFTARQHHHSATNFTAVASSSLQGRVSTTFSLFLLPAASAQVTLYSCSAFLLPSASIPCFSQGLKARFRPLRRTITPSDQEQPMCKKLISGGECLCKSEEVGRHRSPPSARQAAAEKHAADVSTREKY